MRDPLYRRATAVLWRQTSTAVIAATTYGDATVLGGSGPALWQALEEARSAEQIALRLADRYAAAPDDIERDIRRTLEQLVGLGMVERTSR